jgi:hypothetical protein
VEGVAVREEVVDALQGVAVLARTG